MHDRISIGSAPIAVQALTIATMPSMQDRVLFVFANLIGQTVDVRLRNNAVVRGIFYSAKPSSQGVSIILSYAQQVSGDDMTKVLPPANRVRIPAENFVELVATDASFDPTAEVHGPISGSLKTDSEISSLRAGNGRHRELQKVSEADLDDGGADHHLEGTLGNFDQFAVNEQKFGVKLEFNESVYTTVVQEEKLSYAQKARAAKIAAEIEKPRSSNIHIAQERNQTFTMVMDEEALYSAVDPTSRAVARPPPGMQEITKPAAVPAPAAAAAADEPATTKDTSVAAGKAPEQRSWAQRAGGSAKPQDVRKVKNTRAMYRTAKKQPAPAPKIDRDAKTQELKQFKQQFEEAQGKALQKEEQAPAAAPAAAGAKPNDKREREAASPVTTAPAAAVTVTAPSAATTVTAAPQTTAAQTTAAASAAPATAVAPQPTPTAAPAPTEGVKATPPPVTGGAEGTAVPTASTAPAESGAAAVPPLKKTLKLNPNAKEFVPNQSTSQFRAPQHPQYPQPVLRQMQYPQYSGYMDPSMQQHMQQMPYMQQVHGRPRTDSHGSEHALQQQVYPAAYFPYGHQNVYRSHPGHAQGQGQPRRGGKGRGGGRGHNENGNYQQAMPVHMPMHAIPVQQMPQPYYHPMQMPQHMQGQPPAAAVPAYAQPSVSPEQQVQPQAQAQPPAGQADH